MKPSATTIAIADESEPPGRLSMLSPGWRLIAAAAVTARDEPALGIEGRGLTTASVEAAREPTHAGWQTTLVFANGASQRVSPTGVARGRYAIAVDIQGELRRHGCYWGPLDGSWGGQSKRALGDFMERVNATLPSVEPDEIMLSLIRSQRSLACSVDCPTGQSKSAGRCMPAAIVAAADRKALPGGRQTSVAAAEVLPWAAAARAAPLPGRMAMGGPLPTGATEPSSLVGIGEAAGPAIERPPLEDLTQTAALPEAAPFPRPRPAVARAPRRAAVNSAPPKRSARSWSRGGRSVDAMFRHPLGTM